MNGWAKADEFLGLRLGNSDDVPAVMEAYVSHFDGNGPMHLLECMTPKQYGFQRGKGHVASMADSTFLRLPMIASIYR